MKLRYLVLLSIFVIACQDRVPGSGVGMPCQLDDECIEGSGLVCNGLSHTCAWPLGSYEKGCRSSHDCAAGLRCELERQDDRGGVCLGPLALFEGPCSAQVDCQDGLVCDPARRDCVELDSLARGERCGLPDVCRSDLVCAGDAEALEEGLSSGGRCLGTRGSVCASDVECAMGYGLLCESAPDGEGTYAYCQAPAEIPLSPCRVDRHCGAPLRCEDQVCLYPEGERCQDDKECEFPLVCRPSVEQELRCEQAGGVLASCLEDEDCEPHLTCGASKTCQGPLGTACGTDLTCQDGLVCRPDEIGMSRCRAPGEPGEPCDSETDCVRGLCSTTTGQCPGEVDDLCVSEADCLEPLVCAARDGLRVCVEAGAACSYCDDDADCVSGPCSGGVCLQELYGHCRDDACCGNGAVCLSSDGIEDPTCRPAGREPGAYCAVEAHCASHLTCWQNQCLFPVASGPCASNAECAGPDTVCLVRKCVAPGGENDSCGDDNGPRDDACAPSFLCSAYLECVSPRSVPEGWPCNRTLECRAPLICSDHICVR